jgi:non-ribosomal peptide synthetase component E (peptide arylation enzyme)
MKPFSEEIVKEYTENGWWGTKSLNDYLEENAAKTPDKEALVDDRGRRMNYAQLLHMSNRLALAFLELGIEKDDFVIVQLPNSAEAVCILFGLSKIGAITTPIVMPWRKVDLDYVLELSEAVAAICPYEYHGYSQGQMFKDLQGKYPKLKHIIIEGEKVPEGMVSLKNLMETPIEEKYPPDYMNQFKPDPNEIVTMCMTSGTEAQPKGTPRTHNNWISIPPIHHYEGGHWGPAMYEPPEIVMLGCVPWQNMFGLGFVTLPILMKGDKLVLQDGFNPENVLKAIEAEKATHFAGVPAMHIALLNSPNIDKYDLSSYRQIMVGGAPAPTPMIKAYQARGIQIGQTCGSNEGYLITSRCWETPKEIAETIGPHPRGSQIKILNEKGEVLPPGLENVGELWEKGPNIFPGYYKRPDLNAQAFDEEGFHRTGDAFCLGYDGLYRFVTRIKDIIIRGGMNISAEEVEFVLQEHPKLLYAAVVDMPDPVMGERCCAYVQLKPGAAPITLEEIQAFMEEKHITKYKWPERVEIIEELPRTPTGKVTKYSLREDIRNKLKVEGKIT